MYIVHVHVVEIRKIIQFVPLTVSQRSYPCVTLERERGRSLAALRCISTESSMIVHMY